MTDRSTRERWARAQDLFLEALEVPYPDRGTFLDEACGGDEELRAEVASLLEAHEEGPLSDRPEARPWGGRYPDHIGDYRIVRPLGEGGMGVVFLAVREAQGFTQTVALKLLPGGLLHGGLEARLRSERRILARLEHAGIARLIDGGLTPSGQPFFAMEYVKGEDILTFCDARRLDVDARVRLFIDVCEAVHHAHQQLVIHRDLKPSNILVTSAGRPKLLDFGVAKLLDDEDEEGRTRTGAWVTPAYASPEQLRGDPVTTLSDVYALGVLLYQLLAGVRPYRTRGRNPLEIDRLLAGRPPTRPSGAATARDAPTLEGPDAADDTTTPLPERRAAARDSTPERLRRQLQGDLDVIVLKALAHEPDRRYGSVAALAQDLRRYLEGWPVEARPEGLAYRTSKFVRRHRVAVSAAALALLAVLAGSAATVWQARAARTQAERAEAAARRATRVTTLVAELFRLSDPSQSLGDTVTARQLLEEGTARVERELTDQPELQATLLGEVARVHRNLGLLPRAEELQRRAVVLRDSLDPGSVEHALALADLAEIVAARGRRPEAVEVFRRALASRALATAPPGDTLRARVETELAWELRSEGDQAAAEELFRGALPVLQAALGREHPQVASALMGLASTLHDGGRFDEAEALFTEALVEAGASGRPDPAAAAAMANLGMIRRLREHYAEAEPFLRTALEFRQALYGPDHPETLESTDSWGAELLALGRIDEARDVLTEALQRSRSVLGPGHSTTVSLMEALATTVSVRGDHDHARTLRDSAVVLKRRLRGGADHPGIVYSLIWSAAEAREAGQSTRAAAALDSARAMRLRMSDEEGVYSALIRYEEALTAAAEGDDAAADEAFRAAAEILEAELRPDHRYRLRLERDRVVFELRRGWLSPGEAIARLAAVDGVLRQRLPEPHHELALVALALGEARLRAGDAAGADAAFGDAQANLGALPEGHWLRGAAEVGRGLALRASGDASGGDALVARGLARVEAHVGPDAPQARRLRAWAAGAESPPDRAGVTPGR